MSNCFFPFSVVDKSGSATVIRRTRCRVFTRPTADLCAQCCTPKPHYTKEKSFNRNELHKQYPLHLLGNIYQHTFSCITSMGVWNLDPHPARIACCICNKRYMNNPPLNRLRARLRKCHFYCGTNFKLTGPYPPEPGHLSTRGRFGPPELPGRALQPIHQVRS